MRLCYLDDHVGNPPHRRRQANLEIKDVQASYGQLGRPEVGGLRRR